jgi:hypothetical protein
MKVPLLQIVQKESLYNNLKNKTFHKKLYKGVANEKVSLKDSSIWLSNGKSPLKEKLLYAFSRTETFS